MNILLHQNPSLLKALSYGFLSWWQCCATHLNHSLRTGEIFPLVSHLSGLLKFVGAAGPRNLTKALQEKIKKWEEYKFRLKSDTDTAVKDCFSQVTFGKKDISPFVFVFSVPFPFKEKEQCCRYSEPLSFSCPRGERNAGIHSFHTCGKHILKSSVARQPLLVWVTAGRV